MSEETTNATATNDGNTNATAPASGPDTKLIDNLTVKQEKDDDGNAIKLSRAEYDEFVAAKARQDELQRQAQEATAKAEQAEKLKEWVLAGHGFNGEDDQKQDEALRQLFQAIDADPDRIAAYLGQADPTPSDDRGAKDGAVEPRDRDERDKEIERLRNNHAMVIWDQASEQAKRAVDGSEVVKSLSEMMSPDFEGRDEKIKNAKSWMEQRLHSALLREIDDKEKVTGHDARLSWLAELMPKALQSVEDEARKILPEPNTIGRTAEAGENPFDKLARTEVPSEPDRALVKKDKASWLRQRKNIRDAKLQQLVGKVGGSRSDRASAV